MCDVERSRRPRRICIKSSEEPTGALVGELARPEAHDFAVRRLGRDQVADHARRKGMPLHEAERWLAPNLGYEAEGTGD